jgi:Glycosyltransferase family 92
MRLLLILTILFPIFGESDLRLKPKGFEYQLSVLAMFQDEAPYLKEWIEYYRLLGVDHFYLYNHSSADNYMEILRPYINDGIVELTEWLRPTDHIWEQYQLDAYNDCLAHCKNQTNWLAIIDIDEYIVPRYTNSLKEFLIPYNQMRGIGGVLINWQMFRTSDVWEIPDGKLMIECLTRKASRSYYAHRSHKSIVKPRCCKSTAVHDGHFIEGWKPVQSLHCGIWPFVDEIQINHYWLRSEKFLREVKAIRRARWEGASWSEETIQGLIKDLNAEEDLSIQKFVPELRRRLCLDAAEIE